MALKRNSRIENRHLVLCFQVHQPRRLRTGDQPPSTDSLFDEELNREIMERVAANCYIPTNRILLRLIEQYPDLRISFSISGLALEQMEHYAPDALESFKALAATGAVDFVAETYYHSLAFLMESDEFEIQILEHAEKLIEHFGVNATVFKNTNLFYNDDIGRRVAMMGFNGMLTEGNERSLRNNIPHNLYEHRDLNGLRLLFRNPRLSDDIAFRVPHYEWNLTADQFTTWLDTMPENEKLVTIALDYETFGEHHKADSGIFNFLESFLLLMAIQKTYRFSTVSEIAAYQPERAVAVPDFVSVTGCDIADWVGNNFQREAFSAMIALENVVKRKNDGTLIRLWRTLQSSDHYHYMCEQAYSNRCLSPYNSAKEAFDQYMRAIRFINQQVFDPTTENNPEKLNEAMEAERRNINAPLWALNLEVRSSTSS